MTHSFSPCSHTTSNLDNNKTTWHDQNVSSYSLYVDTRYSLWKGRRKRIDEKLGHNFYVLFVCFFGLPFLVTQFLKQVQQVYRYYAYCPSLLVPLSRAFCLFILYFPWKYFTVCVLFSLEMTTPFLYCTEQVFFLT